MRKIVFNFKDTMDQIVYRVHANSYIRACSIMDKYLGGSFVYEENIDEYTRPGSGYIVQDVTQMDIK